MSDTAPARELLVVQSKVRDEIRKKDLRVSEEFLAALNDEVHRLIERATARCIGNDRKTVSRSDV